MSHTLNITAFFIGLGTAYYALTACRLLCCGRQTATRLHKVLGYVFLYWVLSNTKDLVLTFPGRYCRSTLDLVMLIDGWSGIGYAALLFEITRPGWTNWRRLALLSLPFAAFSAAYFTHPDHSLMTAYAWFLSAFGLAVIIIGYHNAYKYTNYIRANYSNIDGIDISWVSYIYLLCFLGQLFWLLTSLVGNVWMDCLYYSVTIALWHLMYLHCRNLRPVVPDTAGNGEEEDACAAANPEKSYAFAESVDATMERGRLWLDPNLSLSDLARKLRTNRTYLSNYFSNTRKTTFYDYVNALRIEKESVPLVSNHPEYTLEYIARQSGFNSLSTFRRAFRKFTGHTPGHFRDNGAKKAKE